MSNNEASGGVQGRVVFHRPSQSYLSLDDGHDVVIALFSATLFPDDIDLNYNDLIQQISPDLVLEHTHNGFIDGLNHDVDFNMEVVPSAYINNGSTTQKGSLTEEVISKHLKTRNCDHGVINYSDMEPDICVVCQDDLCQKNQTIGTLDCGHEYHVICLKKWLKRKNICPLCQKIALSPAEEEEQIDSVDRGDDDHMPH